MPNVAPVGASAGASAWLTASSLLENANGSGVEGDSDTLTPMPSWYISGKPPSGLMSCPVIPTYQSINQRTFRVFRTHQRSQQTMPETSEKAEFE